MILAVALALVAYCPARWDAIHEDGWHGAPESARWYKMRSCWLFDAAGACLAGRYDVVMYPRTGWHADPTDEEYAAQAAVEQRVKACYDIAEPPGQVCSKEWSDPITCEGGPRRCYAGWPAVEVSCADL